MSFFDSLPKVAAVDFKFDAWMKAVNAAVWAKAGVGADDLIDCPYRDWFDDGLPPKLAAAKAIRAEKTGDFD